jgi:uncharacterized protein involved in type VI secretion and phage assembly
VSEGIALLGNAEAEREGDGFINGLAAATVTDNQDPDGLGRVRVRLGHQNQGESSYWARVATPMALADQGVFFLPSVGERVLVGFEMGSPTHPFVIGSLWHGDAKPPEDNANGQNEVRLIRTAANSELRFFDGQPPSVELKLDDGKTLMMDDQGITLEDGQGNKVTIESSSGTLTVESTGQLNIKSTSISIESSASMEIKSGGTLTIKGSLVQIN